MLDYSKKFIEKGEKIVFFGDSLTFSNPGYVSILQEKLPDNCKYTIIKCLEEMGCDKAIAENFVAEEFAGKGKVGDLNYVVESLDNENNWIKIYR